MKQSDIDDFFTFLRFKTIATDPAYKEDVVACAQWLKGYLEEGNLEVEIWETDGSPVVFAQNLSAGPDKETLLLYCHYDVQPVDPLDEWISPPFEPTVRDGEVYARGAVDNKGQCFYTMLALKHLKDFPINVKLVIEGEEESGSVALSKILKEKSAELKADYLMIVDSGFEKIDEPAITIGARGIACCQVNVHEASCDLHSGWAGGIAYNPNKALAKMLASLHDEKGAVTVPGFYEGITPISKAEREEIDFTFDAAYWRELFGFEPRWIEKGYTPLEANWLRPTLEINGIWGGYTGSGFKTVIPQTAHAKVSCRLVPGQDPDQVVKRVEEHLQSITPEGLKTTVDVFPGHGRGFRTTPHSRIVDLMEQTYTGVFGKPCKKILIGGTIPIAVELGEAAQAEMVLVGLGLPGDLIHAPNEHFGLDRLEMGYQTILQAFERFR